MTTRESALATMTERFPLVAERVQRVYGLRLPRHVAVFAALWASDQAAVLEMEHSAWGVTDYFRDGGLDLVGRDGLDERLHVRFRCDPAEFVTVMGGGSDGLHYGLWYDDPAELPTLIAHNYARDSAETWASRPPTLLGVLREQAGRFLADYGDEPEDAERAVPLIEALDWYADADAEALRQDGRPRWASKTRRRTAVSLFPILPPRSGKPHLPSSGMRLEAFQKDPAKAAEWIADAGSELAAGRPALALSVGSELHWVDRDEYREAGLALLTGAYRALGRDALAGIAEVHAAHRDLRSVRVLTTP
ncbi:HPF1 family protein [Actinoplanes hulinensis]|uniref:HPF1 family protein n=1 Tax=Actinoplanes hulinensis TaxID=1144547 RepID=A0ABS7AZC2_9ACTN|nr:ADP-ribosylation family protein [Actinoplanes hulinensis]MBW6433746.1 HPF1 family protein [Actinoplanes hulinensis]